MPGLAVLPAAADVGHGEYSAHLEPGDARRVERRQRRQAEAAVAVQQQRMPARRVHALAPGEQQRDARTVLAAIEHLALLEGLRVEGHLRRAPHAAAAAVEVVAVDGGRGDEARV